MSSHQMLIQEDTIGCTLIQQGTNSLGIKSIHQRCSLKKVVLRNFTKFTRKHLCQGLFFNEVVEACNYIKKETLAQVFSCEISKNIFFIEHLWTTAFRGITQAYSDPCQTSKMERFAKIANSRKPSSFIAQRFILDV